MSVDIRKKWLDYYSAKGYKVIPSAPLVHPAFPMSFNMSAGLVQIDPKIRSLKKIKPSKECLVQKCFRHFDIDKVGDKTHLSFFEMPAAFEVGDLHETQTVEDLWNFVVTELKIDKSKVWITAFGGGKVNGKQISLIPQVEKQVKKLAGDHLVWGDETNTLWRQGGGAELNDNIRMCGPQVEFFYDFGVKEGCGQNQCNPLCGCGRFLEIGNILFIKYYIDYNDNEKVKELINQSTEAVVGLERAYWIVEQKARLFETSLFAPILEAANSKKQDEALMLIADHLKALVYILSEKEIIPGKNGRGRIIRKLIRDSIASMLVLGLKFETRERMIETIPRLYADNYPDLKIDTTIKQISEHIPTFAKTIERAHLKLGQKLEGDIMRLRDEDLKFFQEEYGIPSWLTSWLADQPVKLNILGKLA